MWVTCGGNNGALVCCWTGAVFTGRNDENENKSVSPQKQKATVKTAALASHPDRLFSFIPPNSRTWCNQNSHWFTVELYAWTEGLVSVLILNLTVHQHLGYVHAAIFIVIFFLKQTRPCFEKISLFSLFKMLNTSCHEQRCDFNSRLPPVPIKWLKKGPEKLLKWVVCKWELSVDCCSAVNKDSCCVPS